MELFHSFVDPRFDQDACALPTQFFGYFKQWKLWQKQYLEHYIRTKDESYLYSALHDMVQR